MSFHSTLFLNAENSEKFKKTFESCPILASRSVSWGEIEPLGLKELFDYQGLTHTLGLDSRYCEAAVRYFYSNFSLTLKHKEIVGFKSYVKGKKISMNLQELSELMEIPLGGLDIFGCSVVRADFGFPEAAIQETLFLNKQTPLSVSSVSHCRLPVRVANRILAFNLLNKAGNYDEIHDNAKAMLTCIMRKTKIDWLKYMLRTIARPNLRSLSFANQITNLLYLKDVPTGNWAFITPSVNPINMGGVNRMLATSSDETIKELVYHDPPPTDLLYTETVIKILNSAKAQLVEFGKNTDHIPDYRLSSKRKIRKFVSSSAAPPPPPPPETPHSPPPASQAFPEPPPRVSHEDRLLAGMEAMDLRFEKFAKYVHDGMSMIHEENAFLAKKLDDHYLYHQETSALLEPSPPTAPGFPFFWPPPSYYVAFPSSVRDDAPGGSGAGPSGTRDASGAVDASVSGAGDDIGPSADAVADEPMDT